MSLQMPVARAVGWPNGDVIAWMRERVRAAGSDPTNSRRTRLYVANASGYAALRAFARPNLLGDAQRAVSTSSAAHRVAAGRLMHVAAPPAQVTAHALSAIRGAVSTPIDDEARAVRRGAAPAAIC